MSAVLKKMMYSQAEDGSSKFKPGRAGILVLIMVGAGFGSGYKLAPTFSPAHAPPTITITDEGVAAIDVPVDSFFVEIYGTKLVISDVIATIDATQPAEETIYLRDAVLNVFNTASMMPIVAARSNRVDALQEVVTLISQHEQPWLIDVKFKHQEVNFKTQDIIFNE